MYQTIAFSENGAMRLDLDHSKSYVMTKWYGSSVALFEEGVFRRYVNYLGNMKADQPFGRSVMRFFLSAAVTLVTDDEDGWYMPEPLLAYIKKDEEPIVCETCPDANAEEFRGALPLLLIAAKSNIDAAIGMTARKHTGK
jgi:hypothetical protein